MVSPLSERDGGRRSSSVAAFLLPLLLVLGGGVFALSSLPGAAEWLRHTDEVRLAIEELRSTVLDAETGMRGYLVAGDAAFLDTYEQSAAKWRGELELARRLTTDNPEQQQRLWRVEALLSERFGLLTRLRDGYDAGRRGGALTPLMLEGKRTMEEVSALIRTMAADELILDAARERTALRRWQATMVVFVGGAFAVLLVVIAAWIQRRNADVQRGLLSAVLSGMEDGVTLQDRTGRLIFANRRAANLIGFASPEALLAAPVAELLERFEVFSEDGTPCPPSRLPARQVLDGTVTEASIVLRYRVRATGEERWSNVSAFPVVDSAGAVIQAINVFRDVTAEHREDERRMFLVRAVDELSSSLDYEETLAKVARLAVPALADWCAVDVVEGGRLKRVATAHVDPAKLSLVAELERRYPSDPRSTTGVHEIIRTGKPVLLSEIPREMLVGAAVDDEHLRIIDQLQLCSYIGVPLTARGETVGAIAFAMAESHRIYREPDLGFAQALADRAALAIENARLFRELERARAATALELSRETRRRQDAEVASRFAEMFVGILGHDLRNPLNAVVMTARLLRRQGIADADAVDRILTSASRMSTMVTQLLDLTRSRLAGGIPVDKAPTDVSSLVAEVLDELRGAHPGREIQLTSYGELRAMVDKDRLAQVVSNLVGNAAEHGDPSRPVTAALTAAGGTFTLSVHNDGPPIANGLLPGLFDPFRRTDARGRRTKGLGLGLFISQQIVLAHGGSIEVHSTAEEGTTFSVTLPRLPDEKLASTEGDLVA